jgi:archaellum component FlaC
MIATALERAQQWAEKVQRLEDEIERLRALVAQQAEDAGRIIDDQAAENERLRAALQEIANLSSVSYRAPHLAQAALEPKP